MTCRRFYDVRLRGGYEEDSWKGSSRRFTMGVNQIQVSSGNTRIYLSVI
jgi:hypothetical protein